MKSKGGVVEDMESSESSLDKGSCAGAIHPGHQGVGIQPKEAWMTADLFRTTKNRLHFAHFNVVCLRLSSFLHSQCFLDALYIGKTWWSLMISDVVQNLETETNAVRWSAFNLSTSAFSQLIAWCRKALPLTTTKSMTSWQPHKTYIRIYKSHNVVIQDIQKQIILSLYTIL